MFFKPSAISRGLKKSSLEIIQLVNSVWMSPFQEQCHFLMVWVYLFIMSLKLFSFGKPLKIFPGDSSGWEGSQVEPPKVKCLTLLDINHSIFQRQQKWYRSNLFPVGKK